MSSYPAPSENLPTFNSSVFHESTDTITQGEANELYLSKKSTDVSTAPLTTFQGQVVFNNFAPISNTEPNIPTSLTTKYYVDFFYLTQTLAASTYQTIANMTNYVSRTGSVNESINGTKTFTGTIKSNNYDTETATAILNIGSSVTSGEIKIGRNKTTGSISIGSGTSQLSVYSPTSLVLTTIANGSNFEVRNITSTDTASNNHTLFTNMETNGVLTIGNALSSNSIRGATTFNQNVTLSGTASVTGLITATGGLKCNAITPLVASGQNDIYSSLPTGGTIVFGTASRTMSIYGIVNMVNSCQFSNPLQTNDITHIAAQSNSAKNIYTSLSASGSITIGSNTTGTTTNIRGGAISIGNSAYNLTIESPATFNSTLKTDDITAITTNGIQNIYTTLTSSGTINLGATTTGTITNILGGAINIGGSANNLTIESPTTFNQQATFNNFCPKTNTDPAVANDLVKLSYLQNNYCDLTTSQGIGGQKTFTGNTIIGSALYFQDLDDISSVNIPNINNYDETLYFLANNNYDNKFQFWCALNPQLSISQNSTEIYNTLKIRNNKLVDELQTLTTASETLVFPLQQTTIFTNTLNISVTLPLINNDTQIGLRFTFLNLGSVSTITTFTAQSPNQIIPIGQVTQVSSSTALINNANNSCSLVIVKLSGVYCWAEYI